MELRSLRIPRCHWKIFNGILIFSFQFIYDNVNSINFASNTDFFSNIFYLFIYFFFDFNLRATSCLWAMSSVWWDWIEVRFVRGNRLFGGNWKCLGWIRSRLRGHVCDCEGWVKNCEEWSSWGKRRCEGWKGASQSRSVGKKEAWGERWGGCVWVWCGQFWGG